MTTMENGLMLAMNGTTTRMGGGEISGITKIMKKVRSNTGAVLRRKATLLGRLVKPIHHTQCLPRLWHTLIKALPLLSIPAYPGTASTNIPTSSLWSRNVQRLNLFGMHFLARCERHQIGYIGCFLLTKMSVSQMF